MEKQVEEKKKRLGFHYEHARGAVGVVAEMLMHATVLDDARVARFPINPLAIVNIVPLATKI